MAKANNEALSMTTISTSEQTLDYDVVIVGAGMSGSLLALSLLTKKPSLKVLLLDENPKRINTDRASNPSFDARCIALNAGSVDVLHELGLWKDIQSKAQSIQQIQVSDRGYLGAPELTPQSSSEINDEAFGYVVELQHVGQVLARALSDFQSLTTLYNVKLERIEQQISSITCQLSNTQKITAKLCVGSDGGNSQVRKLANIQSSRSDYHRTAIICNIRSNQPHQSIAYERFTESGPIALLPLTDNRFSVVYCVENEDLDSIKNLSDSAFLSHLQSEFGFRAGVFEETGKRDVYPLMLLTSNHPISHRVVCIGNAAHSLHPVAGQGFNLGLRDLYVLAEVISQTDIDKVGSFPMLNHYWQCRKADHNKTILMTDSLVRIFSNQYHLFSIPRTFGLQAMSLFPSLSQPIIEQAKGQFDLFNRENLS